jgi:hypothetical protein
MPNPNDTPLPEPFVSAEVAAKFIGRSRRFMLALARQGIAGAYPLGTGSRRRNVWVFRLSELDAAIRSSASNAAGMRVINVAEAAAFARSVMIRSGSPR